MRQPPGPEERSGGSAASGSQQDAGSGAQGASRRGANGDDRG